MTTLYGRRIRARLSRRARRASARILTAAVAAAVCVGLPWLVWKGPFVLDAQYIDEAEVKKGGAALVTGLRTAIVACVAALGAGIALAYTARTYRLTRRGQVTDRFTKALERLGSEHRYVRIGGVLALEQIIQDAPEQANDAALVLGHFLREKAPRAGTKKARRTADRPDGDIQAALAALTRPKSRTHVDHFQYLDLHDLHLAGAWLLGADLTDANLRGATLTGAKLLLATLSDANLVDADLTGADLRGARLTGANLRRSKLTDAHLDGATLTRANLRDATLTGANLSGSKLTDADLGGARLTGANLSRARLTNAELFAATLTDANLSEARLTDANLALVTLTRANLFRAELTGTSWGDATLTGANLREATLLGARELTQEQVNQAVVDAGTRLPSGVTAPTPAATG